jgi:hypothetical protein
MKTGTFVCWPDGLIEPSFAQIFGRKAEGLRSLPEQWVPPYFLLPATLHERWRSFSADPVNVQLERSERHELEEAIDVLGNKGASQLLIRSSTDFEGLQARGLFTSFNADPTLSSVLEGVTKLYRTAVEAADNYLRLGVVVQKCIKPIWCMGHLSNERRVSRDPVHWLCEIEDRARSSLAGVIPVPSVGSASKHRQLRLGEELACTSEDELRDLWGALATWTVDQGMRVHFEWVWDGSVLWLVQADRDMVFQDPGPRAAEIPVDIHAQSDDFAPTARGVLQLAMELPEGLSQKADSLRTFSKHGLPVAPIWAWHAAVDDARALAEGHLPRALGDDLAALTTKSLIIRTDLPSSTIEEERLFLPHSQTVTTLDQAAFFLSNICQELLAREVLHGGAVFLFHHYVPALASALCYSGPDTDIVLVESTWGLPDGLQYCARDSFRIDRAGSRKTCRRVRYKDTILDVVNDGSWATRPLGAPWDWEPSLSDEEIHTIGTGTAMVSSGVGLPLQIMWLAGVRDGRNPDCLPWHILPAGPPPSAHPVHEASMEGLTRRKRLQVSTEEDLEQAAGWLGSGGEGSALIELRPLTPLLRSKAFLAAAARTANQFQTPVILHGSILSHAYYILRRAGVVVLPPDEDDWLEGV